MAETIGPAPGGFLTKAIVEEVINDLSLYDDDKMREVKPRLTNAAAFCDEPIEQGLEGEELYYLRAPRGSILARPIDQAKDKPRHDPQTLVVYYPFFSSHLSLPVKPGEHVWVFSSGPTSYWMARVSEANNVEDPNFTHGDRELPTIQPPFKFAGKEYEELDENKIERIPNFPNGKHFERRGNDKIEPSEDDMALFDAAAGKASLNDLRDYELIYTDNHEASRIVYEAVPRLTKRPGDTVLQGSNNTAIILGTERGFTPTTRPTTDKTNADPLSDSSTALVNGMGAIDIVTGRGRVQLSGPDGESVYLTTPDGSAAPTADTTRPRVITNSRGLVEIDKNIGVDVANVPFSVIDAPEGDPDMLYDASRIYVAMKTAPDDMLGLSYPMTAAPGPSNAATEIPTVTDAASIIVKSDEVRIVARWDAVHEINGSIKLVKEGIPDDEVGGTGRAVIALQPDGTIIIDGPKVIIGSGISAVMPTTVNGAGTQIALGVGATEPIVLGNVLKTKLEAFMDAVVAGFTYAATHTHPSGAGNTGTPISEEWAAEHANITATKGELSECLSKIGKTL